MKRKKSLGVELHKDRFNSVLVLVYFSAGIGFIKRDH
jgi:hypothetical protein